MPFWLELSPSGAYVMSLQVHDAVGQATIWNHQSERDVPVHKGSAIQHAFYAVSTGQAPH